MRVLRIIVCLLLSGLSGLSAQVFQPVRWSGETRDDSVRLTATVDSGWHLTVISINETAVGEEHTGYYTLVMASPPAGEQIAVRYNACDDNQCTSPEVFRYPAGEETGTAATHAGNSLWWIFFWGLLGGFLAVLTPCVWPVIPMTISFFLKRGGGVRTAFAFGLSIIVIYVGLGLAITLFFGSSALNALSTSAPLNLFFFVLMVVFALSFFGLFELRLPSSWSTRADAKSRTMSGAAAVFLMAFTLVIVSFSCTAPIVGTLLVEAASYQLSAPIVGMSGFAIALAMPFTLFALFPRWLHQLPRSGEWMQTVKITLAFVELAFSLKFLSVADMAYGWGLLPRWLFMLLWSVLALALGGYYVYVIVRTCRSGTLRLTRTRVYAVLISLLCVMSFALSAVVLPGVWGAPVKLISAFAPPMPIREQAVFGDWEEGMAYARQEGRDVLVQFTGYGCVNCREMEAYVLADEQVQEALKPLVCITLFVDSRRDDNHNGIADGDENSRLQRERFGSNAQPFFVRLDARGVLQGEPFYFSTHPNEFIQWLQSASTVFPFVIP